MKIEDFLFGKKILDIIEKSELGDKIKIGEIEVFRISDNSLSIRLTIED